MLPKINPNGGRGVPGLKLLREVGDIDERSPLARGRRGRRSSNQAVDEDERTPKARSRRGQGFGHQVVVTGEITPVARARKAQGSGEGSTLPRVSNSFHMFEDVELNDVPRGRGLLRPIGNDVRMPYARSPSQAGLHEAARGRCLLRPIGNEMRKPLIRSPSPLPQERLHTGTAEDHTFTPHDEARQRIRQHNRQSRRKAREEEERLVQEEKERQERSQRTLPQSQAYRRERGRKAHEVLRREAAEKEAAEREREELTSARQDRISRYMTPDKINEMRRHTQGFSSQVSQDSNYSGSPAVRQAELPGKTSEARDAKAPIAAESEIVDDMSSLVPPRERAMEKNNEF